MKFTVHLLMSLCLIASVLSKNYLYGERTPDTHLVYKEKVIYNAIPWKKRVKYFQYTDLSQMPIKAVSCFDYQNTEASVNITAGGIGFTFVTLRLKSQRSYGLEYEIEIYV